MDWVRGRQLCDYQDSVFPAGAGACRDSSDPVADAYFDRNALAVDGSGLF